MNRTFAAASVHGEVRVIRVRRVRPLVPLVRRYEVDIAGSGGTRLRRRVAVRRLSAEVGEDDALAFLDEADWRWAAGHRTWTVEYEQAPESDDPRARVHRGMEFETWRGAWSDPDARP